MLPVCATHASLASVRPVRLPIDPVARFKDNDCHFWRQVSHMWSEYSANLSPYVIRQNAINMLHIRHVGQLEQEAGGR